MNFDARAKAIRDHLGRYLKLAVTHHYEARDERATYTIVSPTGIEIARFLVKFGKMDNEVKWTNMMPQPKLEAFIVEYDYDGPERA